MFFKVLKEPILFTWATEQLSKDWEDKQAQIQQIFEALTPWLNPGMYAELEKKKKEKEKKLTTIAQVENKDQVVQVNAFNKFMKNLGVKQEDLNDR